MRSMGQPDFEERAAALKTSALRAKKDRADKRTIWAMNKMPAVVAADLARALTGKSRGTGFGNLRKRRPTGKQKIAEAIYYATVACHDAGLVLTGLRQLAELPAIDAIIRKFDEGQWSGQTVGSMLATIRVVWRALYGETPAVLKVRTSHWVRSQRSLLRRQLTSAEYLNGALGIDALADFAEAAGQTVRAQAMRGEAALLASASELHGRRGEYEMSDVLMTKRSNGPDGKISFYWDADLRKNAKTRIAEVREPRAVALLNKVIAGRKEGPVFLSPFSGKGLTGDEVYRSIRRAALLALGVAACPNSLRDAGASRSREPVQMGRAVGSSAAVAVRHYRGSMADTGREFMTRAMNKAAGGHVCSHGAHRCGSAWKFGSSATSVQTAPRLTE